MWPVYFVIAFFLLALFIPIGLMLLGVRRRTRDPLYVECPRDGVISEVKLDPWYAVRMRVAPELGVNRNMNRTSLRSLSPGLLPGSVHLALAFAGPRGILRADGVEADAVHC